MWNQVRADDEEKSHRVNITHMEACWGSHTADVRQHGALRESEGYWIKTFGLASVIREDSPGVEWELDNKKKNKANSQILKVWARKSEIKKVSHTAALVHSQQWVISCNNRQQIFKQEAFFAFFGKYAKYTSRWKEHVSDGLS